LLLIHVRLDADDESVVDGPSVNLSLAMVGEQARRAAWDKHRGILEEVVILAVGALKAMPDFDFWQGLEQLLGVANKHERAVSWFEVFRKPTTQPRPL